MAQHHRKSQNATPLQSGISTPVMDKTDLVLNLTKPSLYGFYNSSSISLNKENEQVEEYMEGSELHINVKDAAGARAGSRVAAYKPPKPDKIHQAVYGLGQLTALAIAAFVYNELTRNIHNIHADKEGAQINAYLVLFMDSWKPFKKVVARYELGAADAAVSLALEGFLLSCILPLLDKIMPLWCTKRLMLSNPDPYYRGNLTNDILRSLIAFLGILYAVRNMEWGSSLQMALTWSLINPGLWFIMDGTVNGFVASSAVAFGCSAIICYQNGLKYLPSDESLLTVLLFIASFFFAGVIIFGKIGRLMFGREKRD